MKNAVISTGVAFLLLASFVAMPSAAAQEDVAGDYFIFPSQKAIFAGQQPANATGANETAEMPDMTEMSAQQWRQFAERGIKLLTSSADSPEMASVRDYNISGSDGNKIHLRIYDPGVDNKSSPVLVYAFGGGWTIGNVDVFDDSIRRIANTSGLMVAAMDYRLAPEHPFPAGLNDVVATVRWIGENGSEIGVDPDRIALGGHSSGANLALSTALVLRDSERPSDRQLVDALFLVAGQYSPDVIDSESMRMFGQGQFGASVEDAERILNWTFQDESDYDNPLAFPLLAENLTGLPPAYIAAMALDPLKSDSIDLADRLRQEGQEHYITIWPGVTHSAIVTIPITPEIQEYLEAMTVYLNGTLSTNDPASLDAGSG